MIVQIPSPYANAIAPFAPLGRQPVGQESADLKISSIKPLEQSAESGRNENRRAPDERVNETGEQERLREGRIPSQDHPSQEQSGEQQREAQKRQEETEREVIRELAARDREVRNHEQAHAAVGGQYAGSPVYEYIRGPDGVSYAVGGEVSISTSAIPGDPEATIIKARQIRRAASAPAEPSPQDRRVAAEATRLETEARAELVRRDALEKEQQAEQAERDQALKAQEDEAAREQREKRLQQEQEQRQQQEDASRTALFEDNRARNIDINRRLIDIGVINSAPAMGRFLHKTV